MQDFTAKCDAIISLLGCVWQDLDFVPGAMRTVPQKWVSEPSPLDPPYVPPVPDNPYCKGRCHTCLAYYRASGNKLFDCPPEVKWKREYDQLRARYRVGDVEVALMRLAEWEPEQAQAVWAVYVEPWPGALLDAARPALGAKTEAIGETARLLRAYLAEQGVEAMAEDIEGDVLAFGERVEPKDNQIRQLAAQHLAATGHEQRKRIAKELRCRPQYVQRVLEGR